MGTNAITIHLPDKRKQSVIFEIQLEVPVPTDGYPQNRRIGMKSMALIDTGATGSCISRRFAANAQLKVFKKNKVLGAHGIAVVPVYRVDVLLPNNILFTNMDVAEFYGSNDFDCMRRVRSTLRQIPYQNNHTPSALRRGWLILLLE